MKALLGEEGVESGGRVFILGLGVCISALSKEGCAFYQRFKKQRLTFLAEKTLSASGSKYAAGLKLLWGLSKQRSSGIKGFTQSSAA